MHEEFTRNNLKCKRNTIRQTISRIYFRSTVLYSFLHFKLFLELSRKFAAIHEEDRQFTLPFYLRKCSKIIAFYEPKLATRNQNRCWKFKFIFLMYRNQIKHLDLCDPDENATRKNVIYSESQPHLCYYGKERSFRSVK